MLRALFAVALAAGCTGSVPGLQPEDPPVQRTMGAPWGRFIEVDSLRPTLRWQPFPEPGGEGDALARVQDVRFELRIWQTTNGYSGERVYERDDLTEPHHALEQSLAPDASYLWTVRARFVLDGATYVTEWGLSSPTLRHHVVPNPACFRFRTPARGGRLNPAAD